MAKRRTKTILGIIVAIPALILLFVGGLWTYVIATTRPIHPDPNLVPSSKHADPSRNWIAAVDRGREIMRAGLSDQNLPGVSVAVGVGNEIVWAEGFGFENIQTRQPVTPATRFRIGTGSIALTSAAVGLLIEKGQMKLDDEIQVYVPEYPKKPWPVTLRQLMSHTSGMGTDAGDEGPFGEHCNSTREGLRLFKDDNLRFQPGTARRFSSYGWILVSAAVEAAAREPFMTFMRRQVFAPLGMEDTREDSPSETIPNVPTFYFPRFAADTKYGPDVMRPLDLTCYAGASAFLSTPSDLVRFGLAINNGKLLQPATVQMLQAQQRLPSGEETGYGLGWDIEAVTLAGEQTRWVGHDGDVLGGPAMALIIFPERGLTVAIASNTSYAKAEELAVRIAEVFAAAKQ